MSALDRLAATIAARRGGDPDTSWTAKLLAKGPEACAAKFGEEAVEAVIEAVRGDRARLTAEAADVLYHLLVMLAAREVTLEDVLAELERREGRSGIDEKAGEGGMTTIEVENVLQPGKTYRVDAAKFAAMRDALMQVIPTEPPGMTPSALQDALRPHLPQDLFPGGEKAGWWMKSVQLDLEAKGVIARAPGAPVRLYRV